MLHREWWHRSRQRKAPAAADAVHFAGYPKVDDPNGAGDAKRHSAPLGLSASVPFTLKTKLACKNLNAHHFSIFISPFKFNFRLQKRSREACRRNFL